MAPAKVKPAISPELLDQIDVRVGTIESVNDVIKSDKLVALRVNFGGHVRTVLAGMKRELVSEAMLFDIGYADGILPVLAVPEAHVPDGTRAG